MLCFAVKAVLLLAHGLLFSIVAAIAAVAPSTPTFLLRAYWARSLLFVAGYTSIPISTDGRKVTKPRGGDIVVANRSSPLDVLLLAWAYPTALFASFDADMLFVERPIFSAILDAFNLSRSQKGQNIDDFTKRHGTRVIVVFPECTASNNRGVLAFQPVMLDDAFVTAIKYSNPPTITTAVPGSYRAFLWALLCVPFHECRLRGSAHKLPIDHADALAKYARIPKTGLGLEEKVSFVEAWSRR